VPETENTSGGLQKNGERLPFFLAKNRAGNVRFTDEYLTEFPVKSRMTRKIKA
jgi:hypothetical protein